MTERCKNCKHGDEKGERCEKFNWNLKTNKPWFMKENKGFTFPKKMTYPPMKDIPPNCFEGR